MAETLVLEIPLLRIYCFYAAILILKTIAMSTLTGLKRFQHQAFINPEDASNIVFKVKPRINDDNVERTRRAHLNDLENIPTFLIVGLVYICTNPPVGFASTLFLAFTIARFVHTLVYALFVLPQPARVLSWGVAYVITGYMAIVSILHFASV